MCDDPGLDRWRRYVKVISPSGDLEKQFHGYVWHHRVWPISVFSNVKRAIWWFHLLACCTD